MKMTQVYAWGFIMQHLAFEPRHKLLNGENYLKIPKFQLGTVNAWLMVIYGLDLKGI